MMGVETRVAPISGWLLDILDMTAWDTWCRGRQEAPVTRRGRESRKQEISPP